MTASALPYVDLLNLALDPAGPEILAAREAPRAATSSWPSRGSWSDPSSSG